MATELAKAYVQIIPSARGMKAGLSGIFGSEMPSAGKSAGTIFGGSLISTIKSAIAAAGIGQALKASLTEGADLQQSLGGIETLFKDNADTVIANAQQAYRTAGMSANSYMETVTGFSASLLQGLSGDTQKASAVADMALTDMSDNANKMGTSMELIQNAYQGFAKQNYTMLDNLKLGYGGTKAEMERLLADAQELTGVEYNIDNLADVYSAIHEIQTEVGITGTTAEEAATTLTGSFNSMKAAFSDVLGNLALGKDMKPSLEALAQTTTTFLVDNLVPAVWNIISALPGALTTFISELLPDNMQEIVTTAISNFSAFVTEKLPSVLSSGEQMISQMITGFISGVPDFLASAGELLEQLLSAILSALPSIFSSGISLILNLVSGLISCAPDIISAGTSLIAGLLGELASHLPELLEQGITLIGELVVGLLQSIPDIIAAGEAIITDFKGKFDEFDWAQLGSDIIDSVKTGISNAWEDLTSWFNGIWDSLFGNRSVDVTVNKHGGGGGSLDGSFATGLDYVPFDGFIAELHRGEMIVPAKEAAQLRNSLRLSGAGFGASGVAGGYGRAVIVNQHIYSEAKTAADLMEEARYQQEMAVLLGV